MTAGRIANPCIPYLPGSQATGGGDGVPVDSHSSRAAVCHPWVASWEDARGCQVPCSFYTDTGALVWDRGKPTRRGTRGHASVAGCAALDW